MERDDVRLIHEILAGDDAAFNSLVQKYQKRVHALAWRKIGDFHYAEEITQDTFLQVYKKLPTLKNPKQFAGWLYVIANRVCISWLRKRKPAMQSLEDTPAEEIEQSSHTHYVLEQREMEANAYNAELVKKLLKKLPESERTVMTLYYLGEMTTKEIGNFLGVSANTITSRLQRARKRLKKEQELLVHEVLSGVQVSANLSQNIMRQITNIKPTPPLAPKPFLPWTALGAAAILILLLLGMSNRYLVRFQKPYNFEATSEPTIEIVDTAVVLDMDSKPDVRNQLGRAGAIGKKNNTGLQASETLLTSDAQRDSRILSTSQWTQASGPQGSDVFNIFATSEGILYAAAPTGIYRLSVGAPAWTLIDTDIPIGSFHVPIAEHRDTLYIVSTDEIFASTDTGETWNVFCPRPKGHTVVGFIITDETRGISSQADITMYLAFQDKGVFRSTAVDGQWDPLNEGLTGKRIYAVAAVENTVFIGTNEGLYHLNSGVWEEVPVTTQPPENKVIANTNSDFHRVNSGVWEQRPVATFDAVLFLAAFENSLYVGIGPDLFAGKSPEPGLSRVGMGGNLPRGRIFRSTDFGESWTEITPKNESLSFIPPFGIKFSVAGKTLLAQGIQPFRSTDAGETWTNLGVDTNLLPHDNLRSVAVNEKTFYTVGTLGVYQTTDAGDSWHLFMNGMVGTKIKNLVAFNDKLYVHTGRNVVESTDGGESWKSLRIDTGERIEKKHLLINFSSDSRVVVADGRMYWISSEKDNLRIFRLSTDGNALVPAQEMPAFGREMLSIELVPAVAKAEGIHLPDDMGKAPQLTKRLRGITTAARVGGFAASDETFYVEHLRGLFKWKFGDSKWTNTGLIDLGKQSTRSLRNRFGLAASAENVYVGKRDGKLFQSLDKGDSWRDITPNLPFRFTRFKEIVFAGSTVYVATDKGVLSSRTGEHWRVLTDGMEARIVIDRFAVDYTSVYGAGDTGIYRLDDRSKWKQIAPSVPGEVVSLVVSDDKLYISTGRHGMFHIPLEEEW